jgi:pantoate kinase
MKLVTASLAPYEKAGVLASEAMKRKVNRLGRQALERVVRNPTLEELARSGGWFAQRLGLETKELRKLIEIAEGEGALWASQNMIGYSIHCVVEEEFVTKVANGLSKSTLHPDVGTFDFGRKRSGVLD